MVKSKGKSAQKHSKFIKFHNKEHASAILGIYYHQEFAFAIADIVSSHQNLFHIIVAGRVRCWIFI